MPATTTSMRPATVVGSRRWAGVPVRVGFGAAAHAATSRNGKTFVTRTSLLRRPTYGFAPGRTLTIVNIDGPRPSSRDAASSTWRASACRVNQCADGDARLGEVVVGGDGEIGLKHVDGDPLSGKPFHDVVGDLELELNA